MQSTRMILTCEYKKKQWSQWLTVLLASLTLFSAGICYSWTSPSLVILMSEDTPFPITTEESSWIASALTFGLTLGPIIAITMLHHIGPKWSIMLSTVPFIVGFFLIAIATEPFYLYASRFISGLGIGLTFSSVSVYVQEVSEQHNRGALTIAFVLILNLGSLFISCIGPFVSISLMAYLSIMFPVLVLIFFGYMPDSPHFLIRSQKYEKASASLKWLRRGAADSDIQEEMSNIKNNVETKRNLILESFKEIKIKPNPKALLISLTTILAQQVSGVLAIAFYQEQIYENMQIPIKSSIAVIISQVIGNLSAFSSFFLVDRWGRRPLLLLSSVGCVICTALIGIYFQLSSLNELYTNFSWFPVISLNLFLVSFSIGLSSIPHTIHAEIFATKFKEVAFGLITITGALAGALITKFFPILKESLGFSAIFFSFSVMSLIIFVINYIIIPETKNKTLSQIQNELLGNIEKTARSHCHSEQ